MHPYHKKCDEIKRKLRELKKFEMKVASNTLNIYSQANKAYKESQNINLIWNKFFDLKENSSKNVKYTIHQLSLMSKDKLKDIINEYFYHVYYHYYKDSLMSSSSFVDIDLLTQLGLPMNSDLEDVIKSFRELVKKNHPDNGGDVAKFLEIMESYNSFRAEINK